MEAMTREEIAAFVHAVKQAHFRIGGMTPAVLKVFAALEELAREGGILMVDVTEHVELPSKVLLPTPVVPDDDIPF